MTGKKGQVRRRKRLFREDPFCGYCGVELTEAPNVSNEATLEHAVSRLHPLRGKVQGRTLLVCKGCNGEHGAAEQRALSSWESSASALRARAFQPAAVFGRGIQGADVASARALRRIARITIRNELSLANIHRSAFAASIPAPTISSVIFVAPYIATSYNRTLYTISL